jgi:hypothetical protein
MLLGHDDTGGAERRKAGVGGIAAAGFRCGENATIGGIVGDCVGTGAGLLPRRRLGFAAGAEDRQEKSGQDKARHGDHRGT